MKSDPIQILLIEDNPGDARLILEMLAESTNMRFHTDQVENLADGQAKLAEGSFDVILLDLGLPDSRGLGTFSQIHALAADVPILVLTGLDDSDLALSGVQTGAQDYLVKGNFNSNSLTRAIKYAIERAKLYSRLSASEKRIRTIIEMSSDGLVVVNKHKEVCFINPTAEMLLGQSGKTLLGKPFALPFNSEGTVETTLTTENDEMGILDVKAVGIDWEGEPAYLVTLYNVTKQKEAEAQMRYLATHDPLTDLPTRVLFEDRIKSVIAHARRNQHGKSPKWEAAIMMLDLDDFKYVNDTFGHDHGDILLKKVAERLANAIRSSDTVARMGGDEFALIFEDVNGTVDAEFLANKILAKFDEPFQISNLAVKISVSIGVSLYPRDGEDLMTLLKHADIAMYQAKSDKNAYKLFGF